MLDSLWQDIRFGFWTLYKNIKLTAVIVLCLALGIGPNATVFSVVNTLLLRPMDAEDPERMVAVRTVATTEQGRQRLTSLTYPDWERINREVKSLDGVFAISGTRVSVRLEEGAVLAIASTVSSNYFDVLGRQAMIGDTFHQEPGEMPGRKPQAVLGYRFWKEKFAGDPDIAGKKIIINGSEFTITGVMPRSFARPDLIQPEMWTPLIMSPQIRPGDPTRLTAEGHYWLRGFGRLADGANLDQVNEELATIGAKLAESYPETHERRSFTAHPPRSGAPTPITAGILGAAAIVLLIACASVAALLLARATDRRHEISVRLAMGARRRRVVRQLLVESALLAIIAGVIGLLAAMWTLDAIELALPRQIVPVAVDFAVDGRVLGYTLLIALISAMVFGLAPALQATRHDIFPALKDQPLSRGSERRISTLRNLFMTAQFALSTLLLIFAGLFVKSLRNAETLDPGFDVETTLVFRADLSMYGFLGAEKTEYADELVRRIVALPEVASASLARSTPMGMDFSSTYITPLDENMEAGERMICDYTFVDEGYFETIGIEILEGRGFTRAERGYLQPVVIVNKTLAEQLWPGKSPLGKLLASPYSADAFEVIGVVESGKYENFIEEERPYFYIPIQEEFVHGLQFVMRTDGPARDRRDAVAAALAGFNPDLALTELRPIEDYLELALFPIKAAATLFGALGALALILAIIGVYGVVSYGVSLRKQELGIRMALGAHPRALTLMLMRGGLLLIALGAAIGLSLAYFLQPLASQFLIEIDGVDFIAFLAVPLLLGAVAGAAIFFPARRAVHGEPMLALRYE